jgi:hypothetical protein
MNTTAALTPWQENGLCCCSHLGSMQIQHDLLLNKRMVANDRIQGLKSSSNDWMLKKFSVSFDNPRRDEPQAVIENLKAKSDQEEVEVELKCQENLETLEEQMSCAQQEEEDWRV